MTQVYSVGSVKTDSGRLLFGRKKQKRVTPTAQTIATQSNDVYTNSSCLSRVKKKKKILIPTGIAMLLIIAGSATGGILGSKKSSTTSSPTMSSNGSSTVPSMTTTSASLTPTLTPGEPSDCPTLLNGTVAVGYGGNDNGKDFTSDHCPSVALAGC